MMSFIMMAGERDLIAEIGSYLKERFPDHQIDEDWDRSRDVLVFRIPAPEEDGTVFLVEIESDLLENATPGEIRRALDRWDLAGAAREHYRVLLTPYGLKPLPWKQLAPRIDRIEEGLIETFPASDASGHSTIAREKPDHPC